MTTRGESLRWYWPWHKHWYVKVPSTSVWYVRLLRYGLYHSIWGGRETWGASGLVTVDDSPYPYGPCPLHKDCYYLSALSVLHRWTGLCLDYPLPKPQPVSNPDRTVL